MIKVLVTGAGGGGIGEQIIKALRNGTSDYYIICSPFIPSTIQPNKNFVNFDAKQLILEDFNKLLGNK
jgi:nucleoside-diphosphate-sugar epimerase